MKDQQKIEMLPNPQPQPQKPDKVPVPLSGLFLFCIVFVLIIFFPLSVTAQNILHFPDPNLEEAVRDALNQPRGLLTPTDMRRLVNLDAGRREISDLSGLEYAVRLQTLNLHQNRVSDLAPLQNLTAMQELYLGENRIRNISPLERMTRLEILHLENNPLQKIDPLQIMTRLQELHLGGTAVRDLTPLKNLNRLEVLHLNGVAADFKALEELSRLRELSLAGSELQQLTFLEGLTLLTRLDLQANNLEDISELTNLNRLAWLSLEGNQINNISPLEGMSRLESLNLRGNSLEDIAPLQELPELQWVDLRDNYLDLAPTSAPAATIEALQQDDVEVFYEPQKLPFYRGNGLVSAPPGSGGKVLRTPAGSHFTLLNPSLGWRIKGFTVDHVDGRPLDFIAEVGRRDPNSRFSWTNLSRTDRISVGEKLPHTVTFAEASDTNLAMGVQIWPGYADDGARLFYFSEVFLENIYTGDLYTVRLDPDSNGNYSDAPGGLAPIEDFDQLQEAADLAELEQIIAAALNARAPALSVQVPLPRDLDLEAELENIFENIYTGDDYLRYSMQRKTMEWSRDAEGTRINFRFQYHATREEEQIVNERVSGILANIISDEMDEHQVTKAIHDFIVANVAYDQSLRYHSAYAALVQGSAVCQGYALLAYKMLNEAGIETRIISGRAGGENHAWNLVNLDGNWYHLDATWNDPVPDVPGRVLYDFYNRTDAQMRPTHTWDEEAYPAAVTPYNITW